MSYILSSSDLYFIYKYLACFGPVWASVCLSTGSCTWRCRWLAFLDTVSQAVSINKSVARLTECHCPPVHCSVKCPIPTCPTPKFRVKRLRPLPARWTEIAPEARQAIALELRKFNSGVGFELC